MIKYGDLIDKCISCIKSYNEITHTIDSHTEQFIEENKITDENESVFIKQVCYGSQRYAEFYSAFIKIFFQKTHANRQCVTLYKIFIYLSVFRFDELPFDEYKKLCQSQDAVTIHGLLGFLFNTEKLNQFVREEWIKIYDPDYVDNVIIGGLENRLQTISGFLDHLSEKVTGKKSDLITTVSDPLDDLIDKKQKKKTVQKPFNLTKPKPKKIPEPILIPKVIESKPIPKSLYDRSQQQIADEKKKRLEEIKDKKYEESKAKKFDLKTEQSHGLKKFQQKKQEILYEKEKELQFDNTYTKEVPDFNQEQADVRMNIAAILREEQYLQEKKKKEQKILNDFEKNRRDATEFENWKVKNEEAEKVKDLEDQLHRKVEMELAREAAMQAYQNKQQENHIVAENIKEEISKQLAEREVKYQEEIEEKKVLIQGVLDTRFNAENERKKLFQKNKEMHDLNKQEIQEQLEKREMEDAIELKKKQELIKQIRELESKPISRTKGFDPTETMGLGLLEEMSIVELRKRIEEVKNDQKEKAEQIRQENSLKKDKMLNDIQGKVNAITENRKKLAQKNEEIRQEKKRQKQEELDQLKKLREKSLIEVHSKISSKKFEKRQEEQRIAKQQKEIALQRQYLNANQAMVEAAAWQNLEKGAEREILGRQNDQLIDHERLESIKYKERHILANTAKHMFEQKIDLLKEYDNKLKIGNQENEVLFRQERETKQEQFKMTKNFEIAHTQNINERNHYTAKINEISLQTAKTQQQAKYNKTKNSTLNNSIKLPSPKYDQQDFIVEEQQKEDNDVQA